MKKLLCIAISAIFLLSSCNGASTVGIPEQETPSPSDLSVVIPDTPETETPSESLDTPTPSEGLSPSKPILSNFIINKDMDSLRRSHGLDFTPYVQSYYDRVYTENLLNEYVCFFTLYTRTFSGKPSLLLSISTEDLANTFEPTGEGNYPNMSIPIMKSKYTFLVCYWEKVDREEPANYQIAVVEPDYGGGGASENSWLSYALPLESFDIKSGVHYDCVIFILGEYSEEYTQERNFRFSMDDPYEEPFFEGFLYATEWGAFPTVES